MYLVFDRTTVCSPPAGGSHLPCALYISFRPPSAPEPCGTCARVFSGLSSTRLSRAFVLLPAGWCRTAEDGRPSAAPAAVRVVPCTPPTFVDQAWWPRMLIWHLANYTTSSSADWISMCDASPGTKRAGWDGNADDATATDGWTPIRLPEPSQSARAY